MAFRTLKPYQLSVLFRSIERKREIFGCFSVMAITGTRAGSQLRSEPSLWKTLAQHAPEFTEACVIKSQPEFLVFGHAYAYDGLAESVVGIQFAGLKKWCRVSGPRTYPNAMQPAPFEKIRLDWRHAYGGPDFAANPAGVGRVKDDTGGIVVPQFEMDGQPWRPDGRGQAAVGFGPYDVTHPERQKLVGTYDDEWLKTDYPGMARNSDWHFFQVAPPDQRFNADLRGDESFDLAGLHPTERVQHERLPGLRACLFVERHQQRSLSEVRCRLRTVVFLPDADAVVQIWQGITKVEDEDASELTHVLAGLEAIDHKKPEEHYAAVFANRLDEQDGMLAMLRDEDLLPEGITFEALVPGDVDLNKPPPPDSLRSRLAQKHLRKIESVRAEVASYGLDPDKHAPPLPPPREVLPPLPRLGEYFRELEVRGQQQMRAAEDSKRKMIEETAAEFAARGESFDHVLKEMATGRTGPPKPRTPAVLDDLRKINAELLENHTQVPEIEVMLTDAALHEQWHAADRSAQQAYEQSAHLQSPAPRADGRHAEDQKRWVVERLAAGQPLKGFDLTGADLRELDLRGANLDGAMMEAACLDGVDLTGASARGSVLAHATFEKARADDCDFSAANLGKARFVGGSACRANFKGAILWETDFTQAALRGAQLADVQAMYIKLAGADLSDAVLDELLLYQTDLTDTRLNGASLNGTQFFENTMAATNFGGAQGHRAVFLKVHGEGLFFDGADLTGAMFVQDPKLPRASMRGTKLTRVFAHGADFTGADFSGANLDGCELGGSALQEANLRGVHAREAGLRFVDLSKAQVVGADLRGALLANAKLFGARFDASSVFMADLARIRTDTESSFDKVNFGRARLSPRWEPPKA
jgi:uncharacterized protein YjbI with pentapeptide repeats